MPRLPDDAAPGLLWGGSQTGCPRPPAGSPPRWRRPARRAASCNDPAHTARRRADDHGPPAPAPVGTGRGVSILYGSESPKIF
nr:MAG TPA: hypothetical protein [Bacteriophage sp.]